MNEIGATKKCKKCTKDIPVKAKVCPECHSKLTMPVWQKILIVIGALIIISAIASNSNKTVSTNTTATSDKTVNANTKTDKSDTKSTEAPKKAFDLEITGEELAKAFEDNEIKANGLYKDKTAKITGTVTDIGEILGQTYLVLKSNKEFAITSTQCYFEDKEQIKKIANISKGDKVTLIGKIEGKSLNVSVKGCYFTK